MSRVGLDFSHTHPSSILDGKVEAFVLREHSSIRHSNGVPFVYIACMIAGTGVLQSNYVKLFLVMNGFCMADKELFFHLRLETDTDIILGVEHLPGNLILEITFYHLVDD